MVIICANSLQFNLKKIPNYEVYFITSFSNFISFMEKNYYLKNLNS